MHAMTTAAAATGRGALDGFETVTLAAGDLEAAFAPGAGMAGVSLRHAGEELLDRQGGLAAYAARGAVMGIPLLHPWGNRLSGFDYAVNGRAVRLPVGPPLVRCEEHGLPIHGLLSGSPHWRLRALEAEGDRARVSAALRFAAHPDLLAAFPFPHVLALDAALDPGGLTIATTVTATGDVPVPIAFGFHPYLRLPGVDRARWDVRLPARRRLGLDTRGIPTGELEDLPARRITLGARGFDDGFDRIAPGAEFAVAGGGRRVAVAFAGGYPAAQVFSPPGAAFICFEPMTAPTDALRRGGEALRRVAPATAFTAVFRIAVRAG
jgi:aldose 1-epimerase